MSIPRHQREIPATNCIVSYFQCAKCVAEIPSNVTPQDWARFNVGFTKLGIQVWCVRHNCNVVHCDFEDQKHPANKNSQ